jgi:tRNA nucleotidyltransferase/poly(A) polymerase
MQNLKYFKEFKKVYESTSSLWDIIPQSIKDIHLLFQKNDKKLYIVGGAIRDFLKNETPKDFDLTTNALPDEVLSILNDKFKTNLQGKSYGTIVVYTKDQPDGIEITTFRQDITKGRNPEVKLGVTIEDDVKRRDITFNALFYDLDTKEIVDLTGGKEDLDKNIVKMVGDPIQRFEEDTLRILRAFRFASRYQSDIDEKTKEAILNDNRLVTIDPESGEEKRISSERIWSEFTKAYNQSKDFNFFLNLLSEYNMWEEMFPNSNINTNLIQSKNLIIILSNLFSKEDTFTLEKKLVQDYKIETEIAKQIVFLIKLKDFDVNLVYDYFKEKLQSKTTNETILEFGQILNNKNIIKFSDYSPIVNIDELISKGFKKADLGKEIRRIETNNFISSQYKP